MSCLPLLCETAETFAARLAAWPGAQRVEVPDFQALAREEGCAGRPAIWRNWIAQGGGVRQAHVEYFELPEQIAVLHVCAFADPGRSKPIFGFDVVTGAARTTGVFLDLSPVDPASSAIAAEWARWRGDAGAACGAPRDLPAWGRVFSPHMIAARPDHEGQLRAALRLGLSAFEWWAAYPSPLANCPSDVLEGQRRYCAAQFQNEHTLRMLSLVIGPRLASRFMSEVLFPAPDPTAACEIA